MGFIHFVVLPKSITPQVEIIIHLSQTAFVKCNSILFEENQKLVTGHPIIRIDLGC